VDRGGDLDQSSSGNLADDGWVAEQGPGNLPPLPVAMCLAGCAGVEQELHGRRADEARAGQGRNPGRWRTRGGMLNGVDQRSRWIVGLALSMVLTFENLRSHGVLSGVATGVTGGGADGIGREIGGGPACADRNSGSHAGIGHFVLALAVALVGVGGLRHGDNWDQASGLGRLRRPRFLVEVVSSGSVVVSVATRGRLVPGWIRHEHEGR